MGRKSFAQTSKGIYHPDKLYQSQYAHTDLTKSDYKYKYIPHSRLNSLGCKLYINTPQYLVAGFGGYVKILRHVDW